MLSSFFKSNKKFNLSDNVKARIEREIDMLCSLPEGIYVKCKEFDIGHYVTIIIDKKKIRFDIDLDSTIFVVPDFITFLLIIDSHFPKNSPSVLTKTNFSFPSLMDGRDLSKEIIQWNEKSTILELIKGIPSFIHRVVNSRTPNFYGQFHLGAIYELKNFNNMLVNIFACKFETEIQKPTTDEFNLRMILSEDALIIFEIYENNPSTGKIAFWSTLYSIIDIQINKNQRTVSINFYSDKLGEETSIRLRIDNILLFRDVLTKRMIGLKVRVESKQITRGKPVEKKLTEKDISLMKIDAIKQNISILVDRIEKGDLSYYNVNTFMTLCGKAVEHYSALNDPNHTVYLDIMRKILIREEVQKVVNGEDPTARK